MPQPSFKEKSPCSWRKISSKFPSKFNQPKEVTEAYSPSPPRHYGSIDDSYRSMTFSVERKRIMSEVRDRLFKIGRHNLQMQKNLRQTTSLLIKIKNTSSELIKAKMLKRSEWSSNPDLLTFLDHREPPREKMHLRRKSDMFVGAGGSCKKESLTLALSQPESPELKKTEVSEAGRKIGTSKTFGHFGVDSTSKNQRKMRPASASSSNELENALNELSKATEEQKNIILSKNQKIFQRNNVKITSILHFMRLLKHQVNHKDIFDNFSKLGQNSILEETERESPEKPKKPKKKETPQLPLNIKYQLFKPLTFKPLKVSKNQAKSESTQPLKLERQSKTLPTLQSLSFGKKAPVNKGKLKNRTSIFCNSKISQTTESLSKLNTSVVNEQSSFYFSRIPTASLPKSSQVLGKTMGESSFASLSSKKELQVVKGKRVSEKTAKNESLQKQESGSGRLRLWKNEGKFKMIVKTGINSSSYK